MRTATLFLTFSELRTFLESLELKMPRGATASRFPLPNDAGLRELIVVLLENIVLRVVLFLKPKALCYKDSKTENKAQKE